MKITNDFVIVAKDISIDQQENNLSIFKIIDGFSVDLSSEKLSKLEQKEVGAYVLPIRFVVTSSWTRDDVLKDISLDAFISIEDPDGKQLESTDSHRNLVWNAGAKKLRVNFFTQGLPTTRNGFYKAFISLRDENSKELLTRGFATFTVTVNTIGSE